MVAPLESVRTKGDAAGEGAVRIAAPPEPRMGKSRSVAHRPTPRTVPAKLDGVDGGEEAIPGSEHHDVDL